DDDRRTPGGDPGDLDRVLDRLGTRVDEDAVLLLAGARRELGQASADGHIRLVRRDHEALVQVSVDLVVNGRDHGVAAVPEVLTADAAGEVDVAPAVDVPDPRSLGALDDDRSDCDAARDVARPLLEHAPDLGLTL